jgi:hypothetical protein
LLNVSSTCPAIQSFVIHQKVFKMFYNISKLTPRACTMKHFIEVVNTENIQFFGIRIGLVR